jgi:hypothetical protein
MMMSRILSTCSFLLLLGACAGAPISHQSEDDWAKARLACADVGIAPGNSVFDECVFNLAYRLWNIQNERPE